jgi:hypothetical protein
MSMDLGTGSHDADGRFSRRSLVGLPVGLTIASPFAASIRTGSALAAESATVTVAVDPGGGTAPFERRDFGTVGIYDIDLLTRPDISLLLDNLAASPRAFHGARFFGLFTAGAAEDLQPAGGGTVWDDPGQEPDFTATFDGLHQLTSRGLTPFVAFGFFPPAVSPSPVTPPAEWADWRRLIRAFFAGLAADARFGPEAIAEWWFEVWNEPNEGRFWLGSEQQYHDLYRATSEAVASTGLPVRLGGPAIAYKPQENPDFGAPWMGRFLEFIASDPALRCDFVSLHRKGTVGDDPPDPRRLYDAAAATVDQALAIDPVRFAGLTIVDDEADEKVGFEVPYAPRDDHRNAAWLAAVLALHAGLGDRYPGVRFVAAADNADLQLVQAPFDGRRSLMTRTGRSDTDLLKVPAWGFYELLALQGDRRTTVVAGAEQMFPATDLYHLATSSDSDVAAILTWYPDPGPDAGGTRTVEYEFTGLPWERVNVAHFQIDARLSNSYTAAGGGPDNLFPVPDPEDLPAIRRAQELALAEPIRRAVVPTDGVWRTSLTLEPYTTIGLWLTPFDATVPAAPEWIELGQRDGNVTLRWRPDPDPAVLGYEVWLMMAGTPAAGLAPERLSPDPLRAALWVDTAPPPGVRSYGVRTVTASGAASPFILSELVTMG